MSLTVNLVMEVGVESKGSHAPFLPEKGSLLKVPAKHWPSVGS